MGGGDDEESAGKEKQEEKINRGRGSELVGKLG